MKFSLNWIGDFVKVDDFLSQPESLCEALTRTGLEVESIENLSKQFQNVVVAKLLSVEKHSNADRLTLCKVSTGTQDYSIVCGAKNHKVGDKVVLALDGAVLPGDFKIKKTKVRGEVSEGMLASAYELGLEAKDESAGILILNPDTKVGINFASHYGMDDVIIDINVTPNRADCLSHLGLAREVSCLFDRSFNKKQTHFNAFGKNKTNINDKSNNKKLSVKNKIKVEVLDTHACPRYSGRYIEGVTIKPSPSWLKDKLKSVGLKSINNVVDITNYVLWDRGQPLHAFDADKINAIIIGKSKKNEKLLTLDDSTITLTGKELTIRDNHKALALAGVIGGQDSAISSKTKNIFLESAYFRPEEVRRLSRQFGIQTDSSYRFSRGIDIETVTEALDFACALIQEVAGGTVSEDCYDFYNSEKKDRKILITLKDLTSRLGYEIKSSQFLKWMEQLKCKITKLENSCFEVVPPSFRSDLEIKEDLIEEFARLEGYDHIPDVAPPRAKTFKPWDLDFTRQQTLQSIIRDKGWYQVINYGFCDEEIYKTFLNSKEDLKSLGLPAVDYFSVQNPISNNLSIMKNFLTPDVFKNVHHNLRHGTKWGKIFEISPVFFKEGDEYKQNFHLCLSQWGKPAVIRQDQKLQNIFYIKSVIESCLNRLSYKNFEWKQVSIAVPFLHPKQVLILEVHKQVIGYLGTLHPHFQSKYKIQKDVALAEFNLSRLWATPKKTLKLKNISSFLTVEKDLTFVVPPHVPASKIQEEIKKILGSICERVDIFDLYEKEGERAISFRLYLTPESSAWTDENLQEFQNKVIAHLQNKLSINLK